MNIKTNVKVALYSINDLNTPYSVYNFEHLDAAISFQQSAIKSKEIAKTSLSLVSEKEAQNDPAQM